MTRTNTIVLFAIIIAFCGTIFSHTPVSSPTRTPAPAPATPPRVALPPVVTLGTSSSGGTGLAHAGGGIGTVDSDSDTEDEGPIDSALLRTPPRKPGTRPEGIGSPLSPDYAGAWNMRPSPERNHLYSKLLATELMPVRHNEYNNGAVVVLKSINKSEWLMLLRELLSLPTAMPVDAVMARIVTAIAHGHTYKDKRRDQYYLMLRTQRVDYPWLVIHGKIVMKDGSNIVQITLGSNHATSHDVPFMLVDRDGDWSMLLDHRVTKADGTVTLSPLFTTQESNRVMLEETDIYQIPGTTAQSSFDAIADTVTPLGVKDHLRGRASRLGRVLDFEETSEPVVSGSTRRDAPLISLRAPASTGTGAPASRTLAPPVFPRISLYDRLVASLALPEGWDVTRLLEHTREDSTHLDRLRDAGGEDSVNRETLAATKKYLNDNPALVRKMVLPFMYRMFNKGANTHEMRANFVLPVYAQREIPSDIPGTVRFQSYGRPLGTVQAFFSKDNLARNVLSFSTFYDREMMNKAVAESILHDGKSRSGATHREMFETLMNTTLEEMAAHFAPRADPLLPVITYDLDAGEPVRTIV